MQQAIIDCATGTLTYVDLTPAAQLDLAVQQKDAQAQAQVAAVDAAFRQVLRQALASVAPALHGAGVSGDVAVLASLVHKLVADPPQPLSAPESSTLLRVILRCLLP